MEGETIEFDATVFKIQTLVDQGLRVALDLPESAIVAAAQLMVCKREGLVLHVIISPEKSIVPGNEQGVIEASTIRKSKRN